ncbi:hypothetical protein [Compostibacter hankyongensis]|uniref:DUF2267 domain-containing protein n=1 Tax=Compostibacter hankyongensis TaxID=1007089 RepID=A0ABP8FH02_9BACT
MQEFIQELQQKVGLNPDQAKQAVETILEKIKAKVPESFHGAIDSIFSGENVDNLVQKAEGFLGGAGDKLSGMFGGGK